MGTKAFESRGITELRPDFSLLGAVALKSLGYGATLLNEAVSY